MIARQSRLSATSTCGLEKAERYCIISHLKDAKNRCFVCDSRQPYDFISDRSIPKNHRIQNIVSTYTKNRDHKWWQAGNGMENVSIRLDLEAEFHFTHLIMTFKTFRPAAMFIERSPDFGKTWKIYRYFSHNCRKYFPGVPLGPPRDLVTPICQKKYSGVSPITGGQVVFQVLPSQVNITDPYSTVVQDLLKITNLRINFTKLHTLGDNLLISRPDVKEKYYYSLYNMVVRGSCSCYGHAKVCSPISAYQNNSDMVGAQCLCRHNTKGYNCEQCQDFYHDLPWRPALGRKHNACKECNCHRHSTKCHFDPAVFVATNYTSGGVCDECQENTMGFHCEECKPFFYQDPFREITDPHACKSCDCDPLGSEQSGECESRTDPGQGTEAGRCLCKPYVIGLRCDTCLEGFWNMMASNPLGCEICDCDPIGTIDQGNCDLWTGECRCKRFVGGRRCDQCLPGYWNLHEIRQGCLDCDCDIGGAYHMNCSNVDSHCFCRPNIQGHHCRQMATRHFVPTPNWLTYEGEEARFGGRVELVKRLIPEDRPRTWTGTGFAGVYEGSSLEFDVFDVPYSTHYDVVVVYEIQGTRPWNDIRMTLVRLDDDVSDLSGVCGNVIHADQHVPLFLPSTERHHIVVPSSCLEKGKRYKVKIEFNTIDTRYATPHDSILVDSIMLVPSEDSHPALNYADSRNVQDDYLRYGCGEPYYSPMLHTKPSDICRLVLFSYGAAVFDGAKACECDPTGSYDLDCDPIGGQCKCKPNVIGRTCNQCAPGSYGFGPDGCKACDCNQLGSVDTFCDQQTGQCPCQPNAFGRTCSDCERSFWGYPHCRPCQCNDLAFDCDFQTGACIGCRDNSGGHNCERCADGFYGHVRIEHGGCKPCMCPGGEGSGLQHADTCHQWDQDVVCDCHPGYAGQRCDECAINYYGDATRTDGRCKKCECNGNIDVHDPDSCNQRTGECLKCLHYTEGYKCERCTKGYFGDAAAKTCRPCVCNILGTNQTLLHQCEHSTGQCQCLPHVIGKSCDECDINHWKLASGKGCDACDCDPTGSLFEQCSAFDGQCECLEGKGGRDCSKCPALYWGDPIVGCNPCACNRDGSRNEYCDRDSGQCNCQAGVTGLQCDRCARGTTGSLPYCAPCGECFDNWDMYIKQLNEKAQDVLKAATEVKIGGAVSNYTDEFSLKLKHLYELVQNQNINEVDFEKISSAIIQLRDDIDKEDLVMEDQEGSLITMEESLKELRGDTEVYQMEFDELVESIEEFKKSAQAEQEQNIEGAYTSVQDSERKIKEFIPKKGAVNEKIELVKGDLEAYGRALEETFVPEGRDAQMEMLKNISEKASTTNNMILDLNPQVCGGGGDECDEMCGGADCKSCGGGKEEMDSCMEGLVAQTNKAEKYTNGGEQLAKEKRLASEKLVSELSLASKQCSQTHEEFKKYAERSELAKNRTEENDFDIEAEVLKVKNAMESDHTPNDEVEEVIKKTMDVKISKSPEEIKSFSEEIQKTVDGLTQVEEIIRDTEERIRKYEDLKKNAEQEKENADKFKEDAIKLIDILGNATEAEASIRESVDKGNERIETLDAKMNEVDKRLSVMGGEFTGPSRRSQEAKDRYRKLKESYDQRENRIGEITKQLEIFKEMVEETNKTALRLESKSRPLSLKIQVRTEPLDRMVTEFLEYGKKHKALNGELADKLKLLHEAKNEYESHKKSMQTTTDHASQLLDRASKASQSIAKSTRFHNSCAG